MAETYWPPRKLTVADNAAYVGAPGEPALVLGDDGLVAGIALHDGITLGGVAMPTLDPTTGALINPLTGEEIVLPASNAVYPAISGGYQSYDGSLSTDTLRGVVNTSTTTQSIMLSGLMRRAQLPDGMQSIRVSNTGNGIVVACLGEGDEPAAAANLLAIGVSQYQLILGPGQWADMKISSEWPTSTDIWVYWVAYPAGSTALASTIGSVACTGVSTASAKTIAQVLSTVAVPYAYVPFHQLTGDITITSGNGAGLPTSQAITGSSAWSTDGWIHPSTNSLQIKTEAARALCDLAVLSGVGGLLWAGWVYVTSLPTTSAKAEFLFCSSLAATTQGGFAMQFFQTNSKFEVKWQVPGGASSTPVRTASAIPTSAWSHLAVYFNCIDNVIDIYNNGVLDSSAAFPAGALPYGLSTHGITWFGQGGAASVTNRLGEWGGSYAVSDSLILKINTDARAAIPEIARSLYAAGHTLPVTLGDSI